MPKTGMVTCPWTTSVELDVPDTWTSGIYFAVLTTESKFQSEIMFTVLDERPADIVFVSSVNTYQAYNNFPYDQPPRRARAGTPAPTRSRAAACTTTTARPRRSIPTGDPP